MTILNSTYLLVRTPIDFNVHLNVRKHYYLSFVIFPGITCFALLGSTDSLM